MAARAKFSVRSSWLEVPEEGFDQDVSIFYGHPMATEEFLNTKITFEIGEELGKGGYGKIFRAANTKHQFVLKELSFAGEWARWLIHEAKSDPRFVPILPLLAYGSIDAQECILMEEADTTYEKIYEALEPHERHLLMLRGHEDVLLAIQYLQEYGRCHLDIRFDNLLALADRILLCDGSKAQTKVPIGSLSYLRDLKNAALAVLPPQNGDAFQSAERLMEIAPGLTHPEAQHLSDCAAGKVSLPDALKKVRSFLDARKDDPRSEPRMFNYYSFWWAVSNQSPFENGEFDGGQLASPFVRPKFSLEALKAASRLVPQPVHDNYDGGERQPVARDEDREFHRHYDLDRKNGKDEDDGGLIPAHGARQRKEARPNNILIDDNEEYVKQGLKSREDEADGYTEPWRASAEEQTREDEVVNTKDLLLRLESREFFAANKTAAIRVCRCLNLAMRAFSKDENPDFSSFRMHKKYFVQSRMSDFKKAAEKPFTPKPNAEFLPGQAIQRAPNDSPAALRLQIVEELKQEYGALLAILAPKRGSQEAVDQAMLAESLGTIRIKNEALNYPREEDDVEDGEMEQDADDDRSSRSRSSFALFKDPPDQRSIAFKRQKAVTKPKTAKISSSNLIFRLLVVFYALCGLRPPSRWERDQQYQYEDSLDGTKFQFRASVDRDENGTMFRLFKIGNSLAQFIQHMSELDA